MALKSDDPGDDLTVVHRWDGGFTWMAHPDADMQRASHALESDGGVWLVDPLDAAGLEAELAALGGVAGVVVLTNSHSRHADRLATRHDVSVHVPGCFPPDAHPVADFEAPVEFVTGELGDTGFELAWERSRYGWREGALYHPRQRTLVVGDALMTGLFARNGRLEVVPFFQAAPPVELGRLVVDRVLVGHGPPVVENADEALRDALDVTRGEALRSLIRGLPTIARQAYGELRE